jgi:two-component system, NarL family, response regulator
MSARPLSFVIADDHPPVLRSLTELVRGWGYTVLASTPSGAVALEKIESLQPDVALVDVHLPSISGLEIARRVGRTAPHTAVAIYTGYTDDALFSEAVDAGVRAVILKDAPLEDLRRALDVVSAGRIYLDPAVGGALLKSSATPSLSRREREILRLLADGCPNEEIGARLFISEDTVAKHVANARRRLGARTRTQAVAIALRNRLIA